MRQYLLLLLALLFLNSCATVLNGKTTKVNIHAPKGTIVTHDSATYQIDDDYIQIITKRSKDSLRLTLSNDSILTPFAFQKRTSALLFLNLYTPYGAGFLLDLTNPKRFTYKRNLRFKIDSTQQKFISPSNAPLVFKKHDVFVYTTPLKAIDFFTQPMLTLGAEYFVFKDVSISAEYGTVFTKRLGKKPKFEVFKNKGRAFRYELKLYNLLGKSRNQRFNNYLGFETRFLRFQFSDQDSYYTTNEDINYYVNVPFGVDKKVDIFNLKYGVNYPIGKRFYFDVYTGLGIRIRDIKNIYSTEPPERDTTYFTDDDDDHCFFCFRRNETQDSGTFFNFTLGFKFGYKF